MIAIRHTGHKIYTKSYFTTVSPNRMNMAKAPSTTTDSIYNRILENLYHNADPNTFNNMRIVALPFVELENNNATEPSIREYPKAINYPFLTPQDPNGPVMIPKMELQYPFAAPPVIAAHGVYEDDQFWALLCKNTTIL